MSNAAPLPEPPGAQPRRTLTLYQQLVSDSIANADRRGGGRNANPGTAHKPHHPEPSHQQLTATARHDSASRSAGRVPEDTTANAAIHATAVGAADREALTTAEPPDLDPPDLEPPDSEWPEPEWPDPAWPGFGPGRRPSYAFALAASPWFKERYPNKAANLWDALHAGRTPQPAPEPERLADREAGE